MRKTWSMQFVPDSLANDTEVPDSQLAMDEGDEQDEPDVVDAALLELLLYLASLMPYRGGEKRPCEIKRSMDLVGRFHPVWRLI
jgi:hypothetical protein